MDANSLKRLRSQHATDLPVLTKLSIKRCENIRVLPKIFLNHKTLETIVTEGSGIQCEDGTNPPSIVLKDLEEEQQQFFVSSGSRIKEGTQSAKQKKASYI